MQLRKESRWLQTEILVALRLILSANKFAKDVWRTERGFETSVAILAGLDSAFASIDGEEDGPRHVFGDKLDLVTATLGIVIEALQGDASCDFEHTLDRVNIKDVIGYDMLARYLLNSGAFRSQQDEPSDSITSLFLTDHFMRLVICMIASTQEVTSVGTSPVEAHQALTIKNPDAMLILFCVLQALPEERATFELHR